MRARKAEIIGAAVSRFDSDVLPELRSGQYRLAEDRIDNAWLMARLLYYERLDDFEALHQRLGSVRETVSTLVEATDGDPWIAMDSLLSAD